MSETLAKDLGVQHTPPGPVELRLLEMLQEALDPPRPVGIDDDLFEIGADSITAVMLMNRVREHYAIDVDLEQAFVDPTIRGLARLVDAALLSLVEGLTEDEAAALLAPVAPELRA